MAHASERDEEPKEWRARWPVSAERRSKCGKEKKLGASGGPSGLFLRTVAGSSLSEPTAKEETVLSPALPYMWAL